MKRVGIIGYRGYSGAELVRLLQHHAGVEPVLLEHRDDGGAAPSIRNRKGPAKLPFSPEAVARESLGLVFLATPPEVSMDLAPAILETGAQIVDLSGAFRLRTPENYKAWYKEAHTQPSRRSAPGESRLLSHRRQSGHPAAHRGRRC